MKKIDKKLEGILSAKYRDWVIKLEDKQGNHNGDYKYYYDDVVMSLYKCQQGVCAYTEMHICIPELYTDLNWEAGRFKLNPDIDFKRTDHLGEMDHYDPSLKAEKYWRWSNLFMIHAKINSLKRNTAVVPYLKPDLENYSPEEYFDYDESTHRFVPNVSIEDENIRKEIQHMIDNVLFLNHGVVQRERRDYIQWIRQDIRFGLPYVVDRFHTAVSFCINN
ncbi:hypothetical protein [Chitinophaga sp. sic0106]|uniref:hypothetical protein n=1 Tax=Chitinophaga sp. sic0106 TaxID=2854785 RepID=UPI001C467453|nr:hypothetical protein [Chitinophaga sp. sic0106]MBV7529457.1 hypothetical protein [Chitinophaga sp. sic0106]